MQMGEEAVKGQNSPVLEGFCCIWLPSTVTVVVTVEGADKSRIRRRKEGMKERRIPFILPNVLILR